MIDSIVAQLTVTSQSIDPLMQQIPPITGVIFIDQPPNPSLHRSDQLDTWGDAHPLPQRCRNLPISYFATFSLDEKPGRTPIDSGQCCGEHTFKLFLTGRYQSQVAENR